MRIRLVVLGRIPKHGRVRTERGLTAECQTTIRITQPCTQSTRKCVYSYSYGFTRILVSKPRTRKTQEQTEMVLADAADEGRESLSSNRITHRTTAARAVLTLSPHFRRFRRSAHPALRPPPHRPVQPLSLSSPAAFAQPSPRSSTRALPCPARWRRV